MIDFDHCDRKKCSGQKLARFKLLTELDKKKKFKGIVLSAFGKK
jgi:pre-rRNA-processing protein TSR3